ncbi:MAG TPA: glycosyltransferase [Anaerolineaceae bacterium]|nr:glycosyltransferase [Anaerolineaceae bacterium]
MSPFCSIVIRAYNEEAHLGRLLDGILQQTVQDVQVVLVDSGSTDGTLAVAARYPVEVVSIRPQDFTFGRSLNLGIAHAQAEFVVMASAHVYPVYPDWLERLLEPFRGQNVALSYGKQRGGQTSKFSEHQVFRQWFPDQSNGRQPHPFCNNANAAIRKGLWDQHPYDEALPGLEDLAWARWAHEQGLAIAYAAEAEVVHVHNETWPGVYNRYRREGMAFKTIYPQEDFRLSDLLRALSLNVTQDLREAARQQRLSRVWREIWRFRWNQFWGTFQGYHQSGPLTWQLKQTFYYPRAAGGHPPAGRAIQPIQYADRNDPAAFGGK